MIRWRTKLPFCQFAYLCSIAVFLMSKSVLAKLYICCLCRSAVFYLSCWPVHSDVLRTGWWHAPMLLSNGSLGCCPPQAWHRDSKGPCSLAPCLVLWRIDRLTWRKWSHYYRNAKRHYVLDTNDWPLLYYEFIETCSFLQRPLPLLNKETVQEKVRTAHRIGFTKSPQFFICKKKVFLFLKLLLWKISH